MPFVMKRNKERRRGEKNTKQRKEGTTGRKEEERERTKRNLAESFFFL